MDYNFKKGEKLEVVSNVADLKIGDIVTMKHDNDNRYNDSDCMTTVVRDSDGQVFAGCFARRFKRVNSKAELDLSLPIETEDGREVTLVLTDARGDYPICGYIGDDITLERWTANGKYLKDTDDVHKKDLRNIKAKATMYLNINKAADGSLNIGGNYGSRETADRMASRSRVAVKKIELVEGEFDA